MTKSLGTLWSKFPDVENSNFENLTQKTNAETKLGKRNIEL